VRRVHRGALAGPVDAEVVAEVVEEDAVGAGALPLQDAQADLRQAQVLGRDAQVDVAEDRGPRHVGMGQDGDGVRVVRVGGLLQSVPQHHVVVGAELGGRPGDREGRIDGGGVAVIDEQGPGPQVPGAGFTGGGERERGRNDPRRVLHG
jgi:hypothetical protein